jgi:asparagine synthase (glutamine-hydrolysing)
MCGIAGVLTFDGRPVDAEVLAAMTLALRHRGPDDEGCFVDGEIGLGARRLSIVDLAGGHQPMANEAGTVWVVQNGEIYNFPELRRELEERGRHFRTRSDTEAILHVYEEYGVDGLARLRGMFALAIWDARRRRLVLARDAVGIKPLYYHRDRGRLLFASEIRALLADAQVPRTPSLAAMDRFLTFGYVPGHATVFEGVRRLPPGHVMICEGRRVELRPYWRLGVEPREEPSDAERAEALRERLTAAVERHLLADVPVGVFLSGGVDSSAIVAALAHLGRRDTPTFSIGFGSAGAGYFDESEDARRVAAHFGMPHRVLTVEPDVARLLPEIVDSLEEPMGGGTTLLNYLLSRAAREHVTVALAGIGGDELFGGYRRYLGALVAERLAGLPTGIRRGLRGALALGPRTDEGRAGYHLNTLRRLLDAAAAPHPEAYISMLTFFTPRMKRHLYTGDVAERIAGDDTAGPIRGAFAGQPHADLLGRLFYADLTTYLPDNLLLFTDKTSMAASLEIRVPFVDLDLIELAAALPQRLRVHGNELKYLLRRAMAPWLPPGVLAKSKQGFSAPVGAWLRRELRDETDSILDESVVRRRGLWNPAYVRTLVEDHRAGRREWGNHLFALMMFEMWCRRFVDARPLSSAAGVESLVARMAS